MRTILFLLAMFATSLVNAQNKLTVVVDGIEKTSGSVLIAVYDSTGFLKKPVYAGMVKVEEGQEEVAIVFENIAAGEYAVSLFHDENGNNQLDTGVYDIPTEKTGFSNNAKGKTEPPTFNACKFEMTEDHVIYITLWKFTMEGR